MTHAICHDAPKRSTVFRAGFCAMILACLLIQGCSLAIKSPDVEYEDPAPQDGGERPDESLRTDAGPTDTVLADAGPSGDPGSGPCPLAGNGCRVASWDAVAERCVFVDRQDCSPCGNGGRCAGGECKPGGILLFEDFERDDLADNWSAGSPTPWYLDDSGAHLGRKSLASGVIGDADASEQRLFLPDLPSFARARFWFQVSSERDLDTLVFWRDSEPLATWSDEPTWQVFEVDLSPGGDTTLVWTYSKDGAISRGADRARIDDVTVYLACGDDGEP